ncbi:hypothetical protein [Methylorubrum thiocyanatum]|uniref:hypothetical protein n=1 Tax=Methylorubrum thiocyanatum TaxID=47958 RepID=UPI003F7F4EC8
MGGAYILKAIELGLWTPPEGVTVEVVRTTTWKPARPSFPGIEVHSVEVGDPDAPVAGYLVKL